MSPERRDELAVRAAGVIVVTTLALALAGLTWRLVGWDDGRTSVYVADSLPPLGGAGSGDPDVARIVGLAPFGGGSADGLPASTLGLVLKGILLAYPAEASSALIASGEGPAVAYAIGGAVAGNAIIEAIEIDRVILRVGDRRELLAFPEPVAGAAPVPTTSVTPGAGITITTPGATLGQPAGPGQSAESAAALASASPIASAAAAAQAEAARAATPAPVAPPPSAAELGVTESSGGYRIGPNPSPELRRFGLQPGDVIETLNGQAVGSVANDRQLFDRAVQSGGARVEVVRDGRRLTLTFPLRSEPCVTKLMRLSTTSVLALSLLVGPVVQPGVVAAQVQTPAPVADDVVINMRGADIRDVADQVARITGRTLVIDPAVSGQVNVVSAEPLSRNGVWELFLQVLRTSGFAAVRSGNVWRIVPQAAVIGGGSSETGPATSNQQIITRVIRLRNLPSDQAVRALRPLVAAAGAIEAISDPNAVVVTDYAENVRRVQQLAQTLDGGGGSSFAAVTLEYANAVDVAESIGELLGSDAGGPRVSADERSNTVLIRGEQADIAQARSIAASLDQPGGATPITRVVRLRNSDSETIAEIVGGLMGAEPSATNAVSRSLRTASTGLASLSASNRDAAAAAVGLAGGGSGLGSGGQSALSPLPSTDTEGAPSGFQLQDVTVQAAPELNAIVMRGAPATVAMLEDLIVQLDLRRPQVKIEVAIVEITGDLGEQIGVQLGLGGSVPADGVAGGSSFSTAGTAIGTVLTALGYPTGRLLGEGLSVAAGQEGEFGLLLQALGTNTSANLLSSPNITVLDNTPAEIVVGQNVPFRTGSFATDGNSLNPFTTISREDVGLTLRVIPRVHEGNVVKLDVAQEVSSLVNANVVGAADLLTSRRSIQTTVLADDGQTVVLGGLVSDDIQTANSRVPVLGSLPVVGGLFRSRRDSQTRRTLFIFIKPTILFDSRAASDAAQDSYDRLRQVEPPPYDPENPPRIGPVTPRLPVAVGDVF